MLKLRWTFLLAALLGMAAVIVAALATRTPPATDAKVHPLPGGVWVTEQVTPAQLAALAGKGFRAVVDLRPDGEVAGQPSSIQVGQAAHDAGLAFQYIPVPHGPIPAGAVEQLGRTLSRSDKPTLLYCHSGRRAARTWALAEASRVGGLAEGAILQAVARAGQDAGDLRPEIARRIARRADAGR